MLQRSAASIRELRLDADADEEHHPEILRLPQFRKLEDLTIRSFDTFDRGILLANVAAIGMTLTSLTPDFIMPEFAYGILGQSPLLRELDIGAGSQGRPNAERLSFQQVVNRLGDKDELETLILDSFDISPSSIGALHRLPPSIMELDLARIQPIQSLRSEHIANFLEDRSWLPNLSLFDFSLLDPFEEVAEELLTSVFTLESGLAVDALCEARGVACPELFGLWERGVCRHPLSWRVQTRPTEE